MSDSKSSISFNPGWLGLLGVIFVLAKVFQIGPVAAWSWWLVLLPFYFGLAVVFVIMAIGALGFGTGYGIMALIDKYQQNKKRKRLEKKRMWGKLSEK